MADQAPLGHSKGEGWAGALILPPGAGRDSAFWLYDSEVIGWVRFMAKFKEFYEDPARYLRYTIGKLREARELGLGVVLTLDWHETAAGPDDYHVARWFPPSVKNAVRAIVSEVQPDILEIANEPHYSRRPLEKMTIEEYAALVNQYLLGADLAGFSGRIIADSTRDHNWPGDQSKRWERNTTWQGSMAEVSHSFVLDRRSTDPAVFANQILAKFWREERPWQGDFYPRMENEFSATGKQIHCNTQLAYDMTIAACGAFRQVKAPFGWLHMGGLGDEWPIPGETPWGMSTILVKGNGDFSMVAKALADDAGVQLPENGNGNGGNGQSLVGLDKAVKFTQRVHVLKSQGRTTAEIKEDSQIRKTYSRWMKAIK